MHTKKKVISWDAIRQIADELKSKGQRIAFTNGCFDILHLGHIELLEFAHAQGDVLIVGVNSDASIRRLKGAGRPVLNAEQRSRILAALECVDYVVIFDDDTPYELIARIRPSVLVKGGDYVPDTIVGRDIVEGAGGRVVVFPLIAGNSSSQLIEKIKQQ